MPTLRGPSSQSILLFLTVLAVAALDFPALAQPAATIRGIVVDMNGKPLKGASVKAGPTISGTSDASGLFTLKVRPGSYEVVTSMKGYASDKVSVSVKGGETKDVSALLIKQ